MLVVAQRAVVRARRRRPGHRDRGRAPPRAGSAATSTPASAAGCCRTPPGSAATCPPWTFAVEGVTSISVDLHKYAYAPKGTSLLLHRTPGAAAAAVLRVGGLAGLHDAQLDDAVDQVGRPAGRRLGGGRVARRRRATCAPGARRSSRPSTAIVAGHRRRSGRSLLVTHRTRRWSRWRPTARCDVFTVCDEMATRGWYVQPQMSLRRHAADHPPLGERRPRGAARRRVPRRARAPSVDGGAGSRTGGGRPRRGRLHRGPRPAGTHRRRLRRPARRLRAGRRRRRRRAGAARPDGRGQRPPRRRLAGHARGPAGRVPRPAVARPRR